MKFRLKKWYLLKVLQMFYYRLYCNNNYFLALDQCELQSSLRFHYPRLAVLVSSMNNYIITVGYSPGVYTQPTVNALVIFDFGLSVTRQILTCLSVTRQIFTFVAITNTSCCWNFFPSLFFEEPYQNIIVMTFDCLKKSTS